MGTCYWCPSPTLPSILLSDGAAGDVVKQESVGCASCPCVCMGGGHSDNALTMHLGGCCFLDSIAVWRRGSHFRREDEKTLVALLPLSCSKANS